jgi:hypothetical protein
MNRACGAFHPQDPVAIFEIEIGFVISIPLMDLFYQFVSEDGFPYIGFKYFYHDTNVAGQKYFNRVHIRQLRADLRQFQ